MGFRKIKKEISLACFFRGLFQARTGNLLEVLFEVRPFLVACCRFLFQAKLACFNEILQNVNDLVLRDKVE